MPWKKPPTPTPSRRHGPQVSPASSLNADSWAGADQWAEVSSSWVAAIRYSLEDQALTVKYRDGANCKYSHVPVTLAKALFVAPSMGRFVHRFLINWPYTLVAA